MREKVKMGRPSNVKIRIVETGEVVTGYSEAARRVKGNRGCVYLCLNNPYSRNKHKGYHFEFAR